MTPTFAYCVAKIANELEALTIAVVSYLFADEGTIRAENAMIGLKRLRLVCDTTILVPGDGVLKLVPELEFDHRSVIVAEVLARTIKSIIEPITKPGLSNLEIRDIQSVMTGGEVAFMGMGESCDECDDCVKGIIEAVYEALGSPLLSDIDPRDATGVFTYLSGGPN